MSGITKNFKVPTLIKRTKNHHGLPEFSWKNISNLREVGAGSFGPIHLAHYGVECKKVVVKKLRGESDSARAVARALIGGGYIFVYSGSARLVSFEIKLISKEPSRAEPEYMNIHPPPPQLAF